MSFYDISMLSKLVKNRYALQKLTSHNKIQIYNPKYNQILPKIHSWGKIETSETKDRLDHKDFLRIFPWRNYRRV